MALHPQETVSNSIVRLFLPLVVLFQPSIASKLL